MADEPVINPETTPNNHLSAEETEAKASVETEVFTSKERVQATEIKPPNTKSRISYSLFSRETRSGRFFRNLLRAAALVIILVGVGFFLTYFLMYRPQKLAYDALQTRASEAEIDLQRAQSDLSAAQAAVSSAQTGEQAAKDRLLTEQTRVQLLRAVVLLENAQTAIAAKDKTAAQKSLSEAEQALQKSQARLNQIDSKSASNLQALFTLVRNGLDRDLKIAGEDLERLIAELARLDTQLK